MIICPWCGTNYAAFQPNCKNCGGPLPLTPIEPSPSEHEEEPIPVPPPAPRPISSNYAWKLIWTNGWAIAGIVFAILGSTFFCVGFGLTVAMVTAFIGIPFAALGLLFLAPGIGLVVWRYNEAQKIVNVLREGQPARGQILTCDENLMVEINGRHPWDITYTFRANGQDFEGKVTTLNYPGVRLQSGKPACILYLPQSPETNTIYPHP